MTKRNKVAMLSAVILAVLVIFATLLNYQNTENRTEDTRSVILTAAIIVFALLSILIVYISKVKKKKYVRNLNKEYLIEYEIIKDSVRNSQLSVKIKKEVMVDILDMLLSAQNDKKSVNDVIKNTEVFVTEIIEAYTKPSTRIILNILDGFIFFLMFVFGTYIYLWLEDTQKSFYDNKIDFLSVVFFVLISFLLMPLIRKISSKQNPWIFILPLGFGIIFVLIVETLKKFFSETEIVKFILDEEVAMISNNSILAIFAAIVLGSYLLKIYTRKKLIRK